VLFGWGGSKCEIKPKETKGVSSTHRGTLFGTVSIGIVIGDRFRENTPCTLSPNPERVWKTNIIETATVQDMKKGSFFIKPPS
jgi:hypothetical protein